MARTISISEGNHSYEEEELERLAKLEAEAEEKALTNPDKKDGSDHRLTPYEKREVKLKFLELLAKGHSITRAVNMINGQTPGTFHSSEGGKVTRKTMYVWRYFDKEFAKDWDEAFSMGTDAIEEKGYEYALEGNAALIQFLLRIRNPQRYAMNRHEVSGPGGGPVPVSEVTRTIVDPVADPDKPESE